MMPLRAVIVGFIFASFSKDSFEADFTSVRDLKAASDSLERRAICKSLCRPKRQDTTHFEKEISMDMCIQKCIRSKREGVDKGHTGRSRRNAYYQEDNKCLNPEEYVDYPGRFPSSIKVDYSSRKPNLSISWSPVHYYENWTWYALHYSSAGKAANSDETDTYCKLIPKDQHEWVLQNGSGWNYPDGIWVAIATYPHRQFDKFEMKRYGIAPRPPPTFPPTPSDAPTKLIAAILGAAFGFLLLVFAVLFYRKHIKLPWIFRTPLPDSYPDHGLTDNRIFNPPVPPGPVTYYACYYSESSSYQVEVAKAVNTFREDGYTVEMDVMNCNERLDLGPNRWATQQIKKALNVLVFLSPGLLQVCASDLKGMDFSQQEHEICWIELDLIRREYTQTRSSRKMVCVILPNTRVDAKDLPPWAEITYKWPQDKLNIYKRLNGRPIIQPS